jgi:hypothetical protein
MSLWYLLTVVLLSSSVILFYEKQVKYQNGIMELKLLHYKNLSPCKLGQRCNREQKKISVVKCDLLTNTVTGGFSCLIVPLNPPKRHMVNQHIFFLKLLYCKLIMGMYDEVKVLDQVITCAQGHHLHNFQTKTLDNAMEIYYVMESRLYRFSGRMFAQDKQGGTFSAKDLLWVEVQGPAIKEELTESINVYTSCFKCLPVSYRKNARMTGSWTDLIERQYPWNEFQLFLEKGILQKVEPKKQESLQEIEENLRSQGDVIISQRESVSKTFDEVWVGDSLLKCAQGHSLNYFHSQPVEKRNSEDDFRHDEFIIQENQCYSKLSGKHQKTETVKKNDTLEIISKQECSITEVTANFNIYAVCEQCQPVFIESTFGAERLDERYPWVEYSVAVNAGKVLNIQPVQLEKREDIKQRFETAGITVVPDNDRVVKKLLAERKS